MNLDKVRISVVDDHRMFLEGLKFLLSQISYVEVVGESVNGAEFLGDMDLVKPDLVFMDIAMPEMDGVETTKQALRKSPGLKVIALSMFGGAEYYQRMILAGAKGFVVKESGPEELGKAIVEVISGGTFFSQHLLQNLISQISNNKEETEESCPVEFTRRELEVLTLICSGLTNAEIAVELNLSLRTVEGHRSRLISRAEVKNSIQLVLYVLRYKLVQLCPAKGKGIPRATLCIPA